MRQFVFSVLSFCLLSTDAFGQVSGPPAGFSVFETFTAGLPGDTGQAGVVAGVMTTHAVLLATSSHHLSRDLGVAVVNPGGVPASVTLTLRRGSDGTISSIKTITVGARQQVAAFISVLFDDVPQLLRDFDGSLSIASDKPVAIAGLRFRRTNFSAGSVTSLSAPVSVPQVAVGVGGPGAVILPQFAAGGRWSSEIAISNTTAAPLTVRLDLFKQDGSPLITRMNGRPGSSSRNLVVPAAGILVETSDDREDLQVGYAIVTPGGAITPAVTSLVPANADSGVPINQKVTATFSKAMDPAALTSAIFTLRQGGRNVPGTVTSTGFTATFSPSSNLAINTPYTATITTGARDLAGTPLANDVVWGFVTTPLDSVPGAGSPSPQISLVASLRINGSFVSPQSVYADSERIYLCSYQGDLFVLERNRESNFALLQTISLGAPLSSVRGDRDNLYVTSRNGNLYVFSKTWPLQLLRSVRLSNYGLSALAVSGESVYVAKGQAAMTATDNRLYLSELNAGDFAVEVGSLRSYGEKEFVAGTTQVFDRKTLARIGSLPNPDRSHVSISAWEPFVYLTNPGCCGSGVYVYDAGTLELVQYLKRSANVAVGTRRMGVPLMIAGSEFGDVDLYTVGSGGYRLANSVGIRAATGFTGSEDIEIRALWADGTDNLVFAASSWGNDQSRGPGLPAFFVLDLQLPAAP